ncbi:polysaccharide pyruvyl transferase family protein [Aurantiacibacter marinus]|uniref:Polysaccharide pyruvyl transferase domain-containing protein n=1 Tax=Aurantiacibacter marinus TaxID=874156 RepID=A0A0H0XQK7_9SPHN|nr:polysaccharide pyruvyl transferase family protein [Aurantiacibacter marinus]KLI64634.1 hypothetical protein AAV99_03520 [Aurantiacibacter marinus]
MKSRLELINELQARIDTALLPVMPKGDYALVDFPNHANVGDTAIWLGEIAHFDRAGAGMPSYVCQLSDYERKDLKAAVPSGPIFIHGGGNFGDVWPAHQLFREQLLRDFPDRVIVQLPQSIHFSDPARIQQTADAIATHPNFLLLVRDRPSYDLASESFACQVELCPDMAFAIGAIEREKADIDVLAMLRADKESRLSERDPVLAGGRIDDWLEEPAWPLRIGKAFGIASAAFHGGLGARRLGKFNGAAGTRFERGKRQLSQANAIVTDRLHVHIMSVLLGIPHAVLDNSYGKIGRFMDEFIGDLSFVYRADNLEDAVRWAKEAADAGCKVD